ncbi:hypothetical protein GFY24_36625 [Nocardia sp. SYP-A9097]|uniref:hypothetical protein n=1 Tax=Nocardia sp. SYP-A9097 TaxID=2663237 RepID=UPI00129A26DC|nr:hypothetical protein [Nocardia sp. SYP-A9097]MRH92883.1 hypothetical protein [Nocardia sp. SYP-A9097]
MFDKPHACQFCGRYVLEVEGWAESLQPYHRILAPWDGDTTYFHGSYHLSCVRAFELRDQFRTELLNWVCRDDHLLTVRGDDGRLHDTVRTGLGFTEQISALSAGDIFESPRFNRWVFAETAGPIHFLSIDQVQTLCGGLPLRGDNGERRTFLPNSPGDSIPQWSLVELFDFLEVQDLYQNLLDSHAPEYRFRKGAAKGSGYVVGYSLSAARPIPEEVTDFFRDYLRRYTPKQLADARTTDDR